jgi:integrase
VDRPAHPEKSYGRGTENRRAHTLERTICVSVKGSVFKRCSCQEPVLDEQGRPVLKDEKPVTKRVGQSCPNLRRANGTWNPNHGIWHIQVQAPTAAGHERTHIRMSGMDDQNAAEDLIPKLNQLWDLADQTDDPDATRALITAAIQAQIRENNTLPDYDQLRTRIRAAAVLVSDITVAEYLTTWLKVRKDLRAGTVRQYESAIRVHLIPHLGHLELTKLTNKHISKMFEEIAKQAARMAENNRARRAVDDARKRAWQDRDWQALNAARNRLTDMDPFQKPCGPARAQRIRATLRSALSDAIMVDGLLTINAAKLVKMTAAKRPKARVWTPERITRWRTTGIKPSPVMVWTAEQTAQFLDYAQDDPWYLLYHVIAYTGLRRGEAVGVRWIDVNFDASVMTIAQQIGVYAGVFEITAPKTDAGEREVAFDPDTKALLARHQIQSKKQRLAYGPRYIDTGLVFTEPDGTPLSPERVHDRFQRLTEKAGLPPIRLHDLRHGAATHALSAGVDLTVVSEMLGHSNTQITRDTYTSVVREVQHEAAQAIAGVIGRGRKVTSAA